MATKNLGQAAAILKSATAPSNTDVIWQDISTTPNSFKSYDSTQSAWVPLKPSFGAEGQIPRTNAAENDFDYSNNVDAVNGGKFRAYDATGSDSIEISHDGTGANIDFTNTSELNINDVDVRVNGGNNIKVYDSTNTNYIQISHDGTDANLSFLGTTDLNIEDVDINVGVNQNGFHLFTINDEIIADNERRAFESRATHNSQSRLSGIGVRTHSGITNAVSYIYLQEEDGDANYFWTDNSGNFRISSTSTHAGTTSGTVVGTQTSDIRLKNVSSFNYGLNDLLQIEPIAFTFKEDAESTPKIGFSAQQVQAIIPESVYDTDEDVDGTEDTKLAMDYSALVPVLVQSIKELESRVSQLESQINS